MPTAHGFCIYMRGLVLDLVGHLDPVFSPGYDEENDWVMRAAGDGIHREAGQPSVCLPSWQPVVSRKSYNFRSETPSSWRDATLHYAQQIHASAARSTPSSLPTPCGSSQPGNYELALTCAISSPSKCRRNIRDRPGRSLAALPEIELTSIVRHPDQGARIPGRLTWEQEAARCRHHPQASAGFRSRRTRSLIRTPAHTIITQLDMIAYRAQAAISNLDTATAYRATSARPPFRPLR